MVNLSQSLGGLDEGLELWVGEGGTTLRFLALYLSTQSGLWTIKGKKSLFSRPQQDLIDVLKQAGAEVELGDSYLSIRSTGWKSHEFVVSCENTTQVLSGLVLSALGESRSTEIKINDPERASGYLDVTLKTLDQLGLDYVSKPSWITVLPSEISKPRTIVIEGDWSSAAFLYLCGALTGGAVLVTNLLSNSVQPDSFIKEFLLGRGFSFKENELQARKSPGTHSGFSLDLKKTPDLFPVLAAFGAFCDGRVSLRGCPQLRFKESDRLSKMSELLKLCGFEVTEYDDGIEFNGAGMRVSVDHEILFDCSMDHRLVMACQLLILGGYDIKIMGKESVRKSFPKFNEVFG